MSTGPQKDTRQGRGAVGRTGASNQTGSQGSTGATASPRPARKSAAGKEPAAGSSASEPSAAASPTAGTTPTTLAGSGIELAVSPRGRLYVEDSGPVSVPPARAARIRAAFAAGSAAGVLQLAGPELEATLPPGLAFARELGRLFLTRLCGLPAAERAPRPLRVPADTGELARLALEAPLLTGGEYVRPELLESLWAQLEQHVGRTLEHSGGSLADYLQGLHHVWNSVGRVCFNLAENKQSPETPFAFLATYTNRMSAGAKPQHLPLAQALRAYSGDKEALLKLLLPVQRAAAASPFVRELVDEGAVFRPLAWSPAQAYRFLQAAPACEAAGLLLRIPDWWRLGRPPRPRVSVTVGSSRPSRLGLDALLDFSVQVMLGGEELTAAELEQLSAEGSGLALLRGRWVEVDRDKLREVLDHWKRVQQAAGEGMSFVEGMRLLAGAPLGEDAAAAEPDPAPSWSQVGAGSWLRELLEAARAPGSDGVPHAAGLRADLRGYQKQGVGWLSLLWDLGLGACLADDMGLGKTLQVLALLLAKRARRNGAPALVVVPASLIGNWQAEIERFAPKLKLLVAHPSALDARELGALPAERLTSADVVITSYGLTHRLRWLAGIEWEAVILDEAQAVKNPAAKQTRAVKHLKARRRLALTGTPVENRVADLWSLMDFLNPGLLGSAPTFTRLTKRLQEQKPPSFAPLRELVRPYILRRLKSDPTVISDLPDKTELKTFCSLSKRQVALYQQAAAELAQRLRTAKGIERRGLVLAYLMRFKQICNHPSQWLGDGAYRPEDSGKLVRLAELCETIATRQEKLLAFTQFREMTAPLAAHLERLFGRPGLLMHGQTPVAKRKALVDRFQEDERVPFFVLSLKVGGTGLNLTAASHVIHFDRWWNPAVESQATDRAYRIGQRRNVLVHKLVCRGTVEEKIDAMLEEKEALARELLDTSGEISLTEMSDDQLLQVVSLDIHRALGEA